MIRLVGKSKNTNESFLVNAHYDSVSTSHGVTDNGMGTAVALELLRYFVQNPPHNTVIFLFNNFEEGGLFGAEQFVLHPWFSTIKIFVNLEGTGAGGRALVLRSNNLALTQGLASSNAKLLHASPLVTDFLEAKLLKSDTDYTIFSRYGVPGMDIAFYTPRSHYHTQRDDLVHTTPEALQHMGQMALGSVQSIDQKGFLNKTKAPETIIYYDILGRFMLVYSFKTAQIINILALVFVPVFALTWAWFSTNESLSIEQKKQTLARNVYLMGQGFLATLAAFVCMVATLIISSGIMLFINPSATYGNMYWVGIYLALSAFLGLLLSQLALAKWATSVTVSLDNIRVGFYGLTIFWWVLLVVATFLGSQKVSGIYPVVFLLLSSTVATAILVPLAPLTEGEQQIKGHTKSWLAALVAQVLIPATLIIELIFFVVDCMRHTSADGTPESARRFIKFYNFVLMPLKKKVYVMICLPILLLVLHLLPWVHAAGEQQKTVVVAGAVFVLAFLTCAIVGPFNDSVSPNRVVFNQEYNATEALSTVLLYTGVSSSKLLQSTLKQALTASEFETLVCDRYMEYQTRCVYQTNLNPVYGKDPAHEIDVDVKRNGCQDGLCNVKITSTVQNSLLCQLQFENQNITGLQAWINEKLVEVPGEENKTMHALTAYSNQDGNPIIWDLTFADSQDVGKALFTCIYDDWTNDELPAFTTLRNNMPISQLLTIRGGVGLAKVHYLSIELEKE